MCGRAVDISSASMSPSVRSFKLSIINQYTFNSWFARIYLPHSTWEMKLLLISNTGRWFEVVLVTGNKGSEKTTTERQSNLSSQIVPNWYVTLIQLCIIPSTTINSLSNKTSRAFRQMISLNAYGLFLLKSCSSF